MTVNIDELERLEAEGLTCVGRRIITAKLVPQADNDWEHGQILDDFQDAATIASKVPALLAELRAARKCVEAAKAVLQDHLDDYAHGSVEEWSDELEEAIGWGSECNSYKLGRALTAYDRAVAGQDGKGE